MMKICLRWFGSILQEADKFSGTSYDAYFNIINNYFRGLGVREWFGPLEVFDKLNPDPYVEGKVSIIYSYQTLTGEKVLRILVDGVSIPYEGSVVSLSHVGKKAQYAQSQNKIIRNKEKPDIEDGSDQNAVAKK